jgi:hypothetical protein
MSSNGIRKYPFTRRFESDSEQQRIILAQHGEALATLQAGQKTLELKVDAFHKEQQTADKEILEKLYEIEEINATDTDRRITRIEKHLGLSPLK